MIGDETISALPKKVDAYMEALVSLEQFSGSVLIAKEGEVLVSRGYGLANREHGVPNTPQTRFRIGSITKAFTAVGILILQNQGKLQPEDHLSRFFDSCPEAWRSVTIRHLLNHSSGIPEYTNLLDWKTAGRTAKTVQELVGLFRDRPLDCVPGTVYQYSNSGYILLGQIIEQLSGLSYADFLKRHIFDPLDMRNTGYDSPEQVLCQRASGYRLRQDRIVNAEFLDMSIPFAAGALYSTVEDLLRWDQALYSDQLLPRESLVPMFMFNPLVGNYGFGLQLGRDLNRRWHGHAGGIHGFLSQWMSYPDDRVCVVVLSNFEAARPHHVARTLSAMVFDEPYDLPVVPSAVTVHPDALREFNGEYRFETGIGVCIHTEDQYLIATGPGGVDAVFLPESESQFIRRHTGDKMSFAKDNEGKVSHLILQQQGVTEQAVRI